jgi:hypothetical protein
MSKRPIIVASLVGAVCGFALAASLGMSKPEASAAPGWTYHADHVRAGELGDYFNNFKHPSWELVSAMQVPMNNNSAPSTDLIFRELLSKEPVTKEPAGK